MLDIKLETLLAVYELKNFTKAAAKLNLTQPAVSNHIRMLENEIGHPLCIRTKGELCFTSEGEIAVNYAKHFKSIYETMREEISATQKTPSMLKIGVTRVLESDPAIADTIGRYIMHNTDTSLKIISNTTGNLFEMLKNYELDFIIVDEPQPDNQQFASRILDTDDLLCFVCAQNPLAQKETITLDEFKKEPIIMWLPSTANRIIFEAALEKIGESLDDFNIILETDSLSTIKLLVSKDAGVSIFPSRLTTNRTKYTGLPIENIDMKRIVNLIYRKDFSRKNILDEFSQIYQDNLFP